MQAIFRLIKHDRVGAFDDLLGDLFSPARRQAVENDRVRLGFGQELGVDLERSKDVATLGFLRLLAHRGPHIGV